MNRVGGRLAVDITKVSKSVDYQPAKPRMYFKESLRNPFLQRRSIDGFPVKPSPNTEDFRRAI